METAFFEDGGFLKKICGDRNWQQVMLTSFLVCSSLSLAELKFCHFFGGGGGGFMLLFI